MEFFMSEQFLTFAGYAIAFAIGGGAGLAKAKPFIEVAKYLVEQVDNNLVDNAPEKTQKSIHKVQKVNKRKKVVQHNATS